MKARLLVILASAAIAGGCSKTVITSPTPVAGALDVNSFTNVIVPGGSASRELTLTSSGTIAVTLTQTTPAGTPLGVGIGIPRANNQCALGSAVTAVAGSSAQIAMAADGGSYCVKVYDTGTLSAPVSFTISISRP